jgi:hypothetical protein
MKTMTKYQLEHFKDKVKSLTISGNSINSQILIYKRKDNK